MIKKLKQIPQKIINDIDWEMTPEEAIALHLEWGPLRSGNMYNSKYGDNETIYFVINTWEKKNNLHLIKRKGFDSEELGKFPIELTEFQSKYKGVYELSDTQKKFVMDELGF